MSDIIKGITKSNGIKLLTKGTYVSENIQIIPALDETRTFTPSSTSDITVTPNANKCGLKKVVIKKIPTEVRTISDLNFSSTESNTRYPLTAGNYITSVVVLKPSTLIADNIAKDVTIMGVKGTLEQTDLDTLFTSYNTKNWATE